ncbi:hypothetical protein [Raineyella sp. LH-20]|nr:hypothetical protein [Raineyella sp. LH-20]WOP19840.1 hypothetical protein R0146_06090 [Raineyella sp. LH-20]
MPPGNYPLDTDRILNEPLTEERPAAAPWFAVPWFAVPWFAVP